MIKFFLSPFLFISAFILYIASDFFNHRRLKKGLKVCSIIVLTMTILVWINGLNAKVRDSAIGYQAMLIATITHHVEKLIAEQKYHKAQTFIKEFNTYYHETFFSSEELRKFIDKKKIKIYSPIAEETQKRLDSLENKMRSEP